MIKAEHRGDRLSVGKDGQDVRVLAKGVEYAAMGAVLAASLVETVARDPLFGAIALVGGSALAAWAGLTRVRRRLAVGAGEERAVVRKGQVVARTMMSCTLAVDHRVVDGAMGAQFLQTLRAYVEQPASMLV